jgi:hypothetical protein
VVVKRSFQSSWYDKWSWLHYIEEQDAVLCFTCAQASNHKMLQWSSNFDSSFISKGFTNWKDATVKFGLHASSKCHKEAVLKMIELPNSSVNVAESLSSALKTEKLQRRQCLLKLISNMKYLARQGQPLRGHGDESDSNFMQLLRLRAEDDSRITDWIEKKTDKYTSPEMQNELIKTMALQVLRKIVVSISATPFFTIMIDETTDVANKEQVVVCIRWVDENLESHENFIGLYEVGSTQAAMLVGVIRDVLVRLNLSVQKIRGQCYDGASAMSGARNGVATQIQQLEGRAVYTHCYGHALNLACTDAVKKCKLMNAAMDTAYELIKLVKKSPRREAVFKTLQDQFPDGNVGILHDGL